jgi:hypothetical protein
MSPIDKLTIQSTGGLKFTTIGTRTYRVLWSDYKNVVLVPIISVYDEQCKTKARRRISYTISLERKGSRHPSEDQLPIEI